MNGVISSEDLARGIKFVIWFAYSVDYETFLKLFGFRNDSWAEGKFSLMQRDFARFFADLDDGAKEAFANAAIEKYWH